MVSHEMPRSKKTKGGPRLTRSRSNQLSQFFEAWRACMLNASQPWTVLGEGFLLLHTLKTLESKP